MGSSAFFFLYALYFGFFLNRGKTVKYFPTKYTYVISRAVHTIELSFPLINLHLTSLPKAVSDPFVPPFKYCTPSGEYISHGRAGHFTRELSGDVGAENLQDLSQIREPRLTCRAGITRWVYLEMKGGRASINAVEAS